MRKKPDYNGLATSLEANLTFAQKTTFVAPYFHLEYLESLREKADKLLRPLLKRHIVNKILGITGVMAGYVAAVGLAPVSLVGAALISAASVTAACFVARREFSPFGAISRANAEKLLDVRNDIMRAGNNLMQSKHVELAADQRLKKAFASHANLEARFTFAKSGSGLHTQPWDNWVVKSKSGQTTFIN